MRIIFTILIILPLLSRGQKMVIRTKTIDSVVYFVYPETQHKDLYGSVYIESEKLPDGKWLQFFKQDPKKIAAFFEVKDYKLHGRLTEFYFNGKARHQAEYFKGVWTRIMFWHENGREAQSGQYILVQQYGRVQSVKAGIWKTWYKSGQLEELRSYDDSGNREGIYVWYYENGNRRLEEFYRNDLQDSTFTNWHSNGRLQRQIRYLMGVFVPDNPSQTYYSSGKLHESGDLVNAQKNGTWVQYYETGEVKARGNYDTLTYLDGDEHPSPIFGSVKSGYWIYYHPNGQVMAEGSYDRSAPFKLVKKDNWKYFDEKGNPVTGGYLLKLGLWDEKN